MKAILIATALALTIAGCGTQLEKPVIAIPAAPLRPAEVKAETLPAVKFVDITKEAGVDFVHVNGATGEKLLPETMGSGVAFLDYDGDGDQDLFFVNSAPWPNAKTKLDPAPTQRALPERWEGAFRGRDEAVRARQDVLRPGGRGGGLRQRRRP